MRIVFLLKGIGKEGTGNGQSEDLLIMQQSKEYVSSKSNEKKMDG